MKTVVSKELLARLQDAAANGSVIASGIMSELKQGKDRSETIRGNADYFSTKRIKNSSDGISHVKIVFTACQKDVNNENFPDRGNPQAPWFRENRTDLEPSTFVECFRNLSPYSEQDMEFFISALCMDGRVSVRLYGGMNDFAEIYDQNNYTPYAQMGQTSLHSSCMRQDGLLRNLADFYHNFAGAKIIAARDRAGHILGRAIVWENVIYKCQDGKETVVSVLDRIYFSHNFIIDKIRDYAADMGIMLRKTRNTHSSQQSFTALNRVECLGLEKGGEIGDLSLSIPVPASRWHKKGAPYLDTFSFLSVGPDMKLELSNSESDREVARFRSTEGYATSVHKICPHCSNVHDVIGYAFCAPCHETLYTGTPFGEVLNCKTVTYKGEKYPSVFFSKKKVPTPRFVLYLKIRKLFEEE